jgi:hypothetical protein
MPYPDTATLGQDNDTLAQRYEQTMTRLEQTTKADYEVELMWECKFDRDILPKHPDLRNNPLVEHASLNTRDSLYGGRTKAMSLRKKIEEGQETIEYCDVMSLYPYICKYGKFPIGHPVIYAGDKCRDFAAMLKKERLIKCCVMPPKKLFHPVLPYRFNQKLLFCLCRTCAEFNMATECTHTEVKNRSQSRG